MHTAENNQIISALEAHCSRSPGSLVLEEPAGQTWSHQQLLERADALSRRLGVLGAVPGNRIMVDLPPSADFVVAVLAAWMAGASYVPVTSSDPRPRLDRIARTAGAKLVVHRGGWTHQADDGKVQVSALEPVAVDERPQYDDEAYVIFTSGSTGEPKGVSVGHRALYGYLREAGRLYAPAGPARFPFQLPPTFDAAITSYLLPLVHGGVCVPLAGARPVTALLSDFFRETESPVVLKTTPSQIQLLGRLLEPRTVRALSGSFVIGGEALSYEQCEWLRDAEGVTLHNEYGPTEATVGCIIHSFPATLRATGPVPIGRPHEGIQLGLVPTGSEFGLSLSGECLANGYLGDRRGGFRYQDGLRVYDTGDLVSVKDGLLYYEGRTDDQVKIGGYRVELGEVETALASLAPGRQVVAEIVDGVLVGGVVGGDGEDFSGLAAGIRPLLPRHMVPRVVRTIGELPLTSHGKLDRRRLRGLLRELGEN